MQFEIFRKYADEVRHGLSVRVGGVSSGPYESMNLGLVGDEQKNIEENYRRFGAEVGFDVQKLCIPYQEHTDKVAVISEGVGLGNPFEGIDGFITAEKGVPIGVRFADCQGVLMYEPERKVIAAVHSGWRGNVQNMIGKTVGRMVKEFDCDAEKNLVGVSQSLGPCCAEFSDPATELPEFMQQYVDEKKHVDLWTCSLDQLREAGVLEENVEMTRRCTKCENDVFFSCRAAEGGPFGHMAGVIELT